MNKADIALVLSVFSAAITVLSLGTNVAMVLYTRRLALNDTRRMERKAPIFEITIRPCEASPGWQDLLLIVRNPEPVAAELTAIRSRRAGTRLFFAHDVLEPDGFGGDDAGFLKPGIDPAAGSPELTCNLHIPASTDVRTPRRRQALARLRLVAHGSVDRADLAFDWSWKDAG